MICPAYDRLRIPAAFADSRIAALCAFLLGRTPFPLRRSLKIPDFIMNFEDAQFVPPPRQLNPCAFGASDFAAPSRLSAPEMLLSPIFSVGAAFRAQTKITLCCG